MSEKLNLGDVTALLKSDEAVVRNLFETGRLHGMRAGDGWTTTPELLEGDLELLGDAARIDRFRAGISPEPPGPENPHTFLTIEWVDRALERVKG